MRKKIIAKILCFGLTLVLFTGMTGVVFAADATTGLYSLGNAGNYKNFINYVDGYSLYVDPGMQVDMNYSSVCAVLENEHKRIEIYKETLPYSVGQRSYINYSNQFMDNTADHIKEYDTQTIINGNAVHILQWSRQKLSRVENDKNYYVSLEILSGYQEVYTIFVKSDTPFYQTNGYYYLLNDFQTFAPSQYAYTKQAQAVSVEDRGWNQETQDFYQMYFGADSLLKWGIFEPNAPDDFTQLSYLESSMEYKFPILLNYTNFENTEKHPNLEVRLENAYTQNKTLELTLQTAWTPSGQGNMVYDVLNGEYDSFLKNYAQTVSDFDHPVLFRLGNEMNGDWCPYSSYNTSKDTEIYKEFYRYVYKAFEDAGADNVIWVWNPNGKSFPDFKWNDALMYYPGDEYVDIIGLTAYNTGTYYSGENWTEFADLYDPIYAEYTKLYKQPMMITEFASSSVGGDKNLWIQKMFGHIGNYDRVKVAIWWDGCDWDTNGNVARPYFMDETYPIVQTFKEWLNKKPLFWDVLG